MAREAAACPFCQALRPTLCQLRDAAAVVALAEVEAPTESGATRVRLHRVLAGEDQLRGQTSLSIPLDLAAKPGSLLLLLGTAADAVATASARETPLAWHAVEVNEGSYGYFARAPRPEVATAERLKYFAPYLEHADPLVAEDAYLEFGHAPFDVVSQVAQRLPDEQVGKWLSDARVPAHRKGFYGLVLGLAIDPGQRARNAELLREHILAPEDDFRAGFDGVLGGYLLLTGDAGLDLIEERYLANPQAADGDVRHALAALRFYREHGRGIPKQRLNDALRTLLVRPEFAEAATIDLARWQDWEAAGQIASLYGRPEYARPGTRRAIVGYLLACPEEQGGRLLGELRAADPQGVAEAEQVLGRTSSLPQAQ